MVKSVFRGLTRDDAMRQGEADAQLARANGYEPAGQDWADESGINVLTVLYRDTGRVPAVSGRATDGAFKWRHWWFWSAVVAAALVAVGPAARRGFGTTDYIISVAGSFVLWVVIFLTIHIIVTSIRRFVRRV